MKYEVSFKRASNALMASSSERLRRNLSWTCRVGRRGQPGLVWAKRKKGEERRSEAHLQNRLIRFHLDIRNIGIDHQRNEVDDEVGILAKGGESGVAKTLEPGVVRRVHPSHGVDHLFADFDGGREGLGIAAEDVAEVDWKCVGGRERRRSQRVARSRKSLEARRHSPWKK